MSRERRIEKIMLVFPPARIPPVQDKLACMPMGISYLASVLRNDYEVKILDTIVEGYNEERWINPYTLEYGLEHKKILQRIEEFSPDVVGISSLFSSQFQSVAELAFHIKDRFRDIILVIGGTHASYVPEKILKVHKEIDYIILGEAEESFPSLLRAIQTGKDFEEVDGLAYRENGEIKINPKTRLIEDLDSIPFPSRDLLPIEKYFEINVPFLLFSKSPRNISFITSRGCPFRCRFCASSAFWMHRLRLRSVENVLSEMDELVNRYNVKELKFEDDNLLADAKRAKAIFRGMIERGYKLKWNTPNGVMVKRLLDEELLKLMKESGCFEVVLAFESGCQEVIDKIIKKPIDLSIGREVVSKLRAYDIDVHAFFIIGFPGETKEQIKQTINYAKSLKMDKVFFFIFNPLPGSELYEECLQKGIIDEKLFETKNYYYSGISTGEFDQAFLTRIRFNAHWQDTFSALLYHPDKFFAKYLKRVMRKEMLITLSRIFLFYMKTIRKNS